MPKRKQGAAVEVQAMLCSLCVAAGTVVPCSATQVHGHSHNVDWELMIVITL